MINQKILPILAAKGKFESTRTKLLDDMVMLDQKLENSCFMITNEIDSIKDPII